LVYEPGFLRYAEQHHPDVEARSPLTRACRLDGPGIATVARTHRKSAAQVLLR
jgi:diketogulonate reductase-like aldo/keto reductase